MILATIPSPTQGVWDLGPLPIRAYALCIVAGIVAAVLLTEKRWVARGGAPGDVLDIAVWAVPFGIVGGRLYHVDHQPRGLLRRAAGTRSGPSPSGRAASASGARSPSAASAPGSPAAAAASRCRPSPTPWRPGCWSPRPIGRLGNWFNNELYGGPTSLPVAAEDLRVGRRPGGARAPTTSPIVLGYFHPTFLYELLWNLAAAAFVIWADRRFRLGHGRAFALYVVSYCLGPAVGRAAAHRPRRCTSSASGSTCSPRSSSASGRWPTSSPCAAGRAR